MRTRRGRRRINPQAADHQKQQRAAEMELRRLTAANAAVAKAQQRLAAWDVEKNAPPDVLDQPSPPRVEAAAAAAGMGA